MRERRGEKAVPIPLHRISNATPPQAIQCQTFIQFSFSFFVAGLEGFEKK